MYLVSLLAKLLSKEYFLYKGRLAVKALNSLANREDGVMDSMLACLAVKAVMIPVLSKWSSLNLSGKRW